MRIVGILDKLIKKLFLSISSEARRAFNKLLDLLNTLVMPTHIGKERLTVST